MVVLVLLLLLLLVCYLSFSGNDSDCLSLFHDETRINGQDVTLQDIKKCKKRKDYRIGVVCVSIGDRKFSKITRKRLNEYCDKHGYTLEYSTEAVDRNYSVMWQKICAVRDALSRYDAVVWVDDDILITNKNIKLENYLNYINEDLIFSRDASFFKVRVINSGLFMVKNTAIGHKFIDNVLSMYNVFGGRFKYQNCHEQTIITMLYMKKYHPYAVVLNDGVMQSYQGTHVNNLVKNSWRPGHFCLHLCGESSEYRENVFSELYFLHP